MYREKSWMPHGVQREDTHREKAETNVEAEEERQRQRQACCSGLSSQGHCPWLNELFVQAHAVPDDDVGGNAGQVQVRSTKLATSLKGPLAEPR